MPKTQRIRLTKPRKAHSRTRGTIAQKNARMRNLKHSCHPKGKVLNWKPIRNTLRSQLKSGALNK